MGELVIRYTDKEGRVYHGDSTPPSCDAVFYGYEEYGREDAVLGDAEGELRG